MCVRVQKSGLPESIGELRNLEELLVDNNRLSGERLQTQALA